MATPLILLCVLSLIGGYFSLPVERVFPTHGNQHPAHWVELVSISIPIVGVVLAYLLFLGRQLDLSFLIESALGQWLKQFWHSGWRIDRLYALTLVNPYCWVASTTRNEPVDNFYHLIVRTNQALNSGLSRMQTGRMRGYIISMVIGLIGFLGLSLLFAVGAV